MSDALAGKPGELRFTLEITRANGEVETVEMIGTVVPDEQEVKD